MTPKKTPDWILSIPRCPKCGSFPSGTIVTLRDCTVLLAPLSSSPDCNEFIYTGETHVNWKGQKTDKATYDGIERVLLECPQGHLWRSPFTTPAPDPTPDPTPDQE